MRDPRLLTGPLLLLCFTLPLGASAATCDPDPPSFPDRSRAPARSDCCAAKTDDYCASGSSAPLVEGKRNVVVAVLDDHGYCSASFMLGRCVDPSQAPAPCTEPVCTGAAWIRCPTGDPKRDCPAGTATCTGGLGRVCTTNRSMPCTDASECPPAGDGGEVDCVDRCANNIGRTCDTDLDCAVTLGPSTTCIDGTCSPRAPCVPLTKANPGGRDSDFACARGFGRCEVGTNSCEGTGYPCSKDSDCNDHCETQDGVYRCKRTPTYCATNGDCGSSEVCTTSRHPLRLADISCRYRRPGSISWAYDPTARSLPAGENLVFTPQIDRLATEGVVFARGRASGVKCESTRAVLQTGRVLRHRNASNANDSGKGGQCGAKADWFYDLPVGCNDGDATSGAEECPLSFGRTCDDVTSYPLPGETEKGGYHTLFWWMQERTPGGFRTEMLDTPGHPAIGTDDVFGIAAGKMELPPPAAKTAWDKTVQQGGCPAFGKLTCLSSPADACADALDAGRIPWAAIDPASNYSVAKVSSELVRAVTADGLLKPALPQDPEEKPLFLWYGPHLPHVGWAAYKMTYFNALYEPDGGTLDSGEHHLGRTSLFDAGLEALIDDLKRTCVCGPGAGRQRQDSLWEHTVVVVVPDNTYLLPKSKFSSGVNAVSENANRIPIVIREPNLQGAPFVMGDQDQFASQWDLLPTVLDYTNAYREQGHASYAEELNRYPLARNLRPQASGGISDGIFGGIGIVRDVAYGALSDTGITDTQEEGQHRYLMPRAGMIGVCLQPSSPFCLLGEPCPCLGQPGCPCCRCIEVRYCANNGAVCDDDSDCGTCDQHQCAVGSVRDFDGRSCNSGRDCVPIGVCRPPLVKIVQSGPLTSPKTQVYEVNRDPDENVDLGPGMLGGTLLTQATSCLTEFWKLDPSNDLGVWLPTAQAGCPEALREWRTCTAPDNCSPPP